MKITVMDKGDELVFEVPNGAQCQYSLVCFNTPVTMIHFEGNGWYPTDWMAVCQDCKNFYDKITGADVAEKPTDISNINKDDKTLDKAGQREKTGDPAGDALVDLANDVDNG